MFRHSTILILAATVFICLGGCAHRDSGKVTIRYMAWGNADHLAVEQAIIDRFEKSHPNIHVKLFMVPDSAYHQKLQIMLASRSAPDVMKVDLYFFPALVRKGYFRSIQPFIDADPTFDEADFFPQALEECRYKGQLYGLNVAFGGHVIYYNKTMFKNEGIPDPYELYKRGEWTTDKFVEVASKLTKKDKNGRYTQFGTNMPHWWTAVWLFGGDFLSKDFKRCTLDTPEAIRGLQWMKDLRWKYHVTPQPSESSMSAFSFQSGKLGMYSAWSGMTPVFLKQATGFEWDIAPEPKGPAGRFTPMKGNQLTVYAESEHPREAYEFIKFVTSAENEMWVCGQLRRSITTHKSVARNPEYLKAYTPPYQTDVFLHEMDYGRQIPINYRYQAWYEEFISGLDLMLTNEMDAKEAVKWMVPRINQALQEEDW